MKKVIWFLVIAAAIAGLVMAYIGYREMQEAPPASASVSPANLKAGDSISSPLHVTGSAPGTWFFEASFPVTIVDWDGLIIGQGHSQAQGDWMQEGPVAFTADIPFTRPACSADYCRKGTIIFRNDNPSGDPARDKFLEVPIVFK